MRNAAIGVEEFYEFDAVHPLNPKRWSVTMKRDGRISGDGVELRLDGQPAANGGVDS